MTGSSAPSLAVQPLRLADLAALADATDHVSRNKNDRGRGERRRDNPHHFSGTPQFATASITVPPSSGEARNVARKDDDAVERPERQGDDAVHQYRSLELFAGACGGWTLGLHWAGIETIAACEIDPWRRAAYLTNFPGVRMYEDVRLLTGERLAADGVVPDIIVGSPPCQDASTANTKGKGIDGERTGLFFEFVRLVRELRPAWCVAENVPGLRVRGADRVLAELEAAGYACWPLVVGADDLGAPHRRKRVWIIAHTTRNGFGSRRPGRSRASASGQPEQSLQAPHAIGERLRQQRLSRGLDEASPIAADDADDTATSRCGSWQPGSRGPVWNKARRSQSERRCGADDAGNAESEQMGRARLAWEDGRHSGDTLGEGLAIGESIGPDTRAQLSAIEQAVGEEGYLWNGSPLDHIGLASGLSTGLARASASAYGDSIIPQIAFLIGRAIRRIDGYDL